MVILGTAWRSGSSSSDRSSSASPTSRLTRCGSPEAGSRPRRRLPGNDLSTYPDFPAEIRAPAGSLPGVSGFQLHYGRPRHPDPGRSARRARSDEPGGVEDEPRATCRREPPSSSTRTRSRARNLQKAGYADAARLRTGRSTATTRIRCRSPHADGRRACGDRGGDAAGGRAVEEHVRARPDELAVRSRDGGDDRSSCEGKFAKRPDWPSEPWKAFTTAYHFGETSEGFSVQYEVRGRCAPPRGATARSRATWRCRTD